LPVASSTADRTRIEIAFDGGQTIGLIVSFVDANALDDALASGREDALTLEAESGRYTIALRRIVYVKRFAREGRVGFQNP
jgi:hypothetical protein